MRLCSPGVRAASIAATSFAASNFALLMREVESLPYSEIGRRLGVLLGTVRMRIFRGRHAVAAALAPVRLSFSSGGF